MSNRSKRWSERLNGRLNELKSASEQSNVENMDRQVGWAKSKYRQRVGWAKTSSLRSPRRCQRRTRGLTGRWRRSPGTPRSTSLRTRAAGGESLWRLPSASHEVDGELRGRELGKLTRASQKGRALKSRRKGQGVEAGFHGRTFLKQRARSLPRYRTE